MTGRSLRPSTWATPPADIHQTFALLLGWGVLVHKLAKADMITSVWSLAVTIGAVALLFRPASVPALSLLFGGVIGQVVAGFDLFGNHWPFLGLLGLVWLGLVMVEGRAGRGRDLAWLGPRFFPVARAAFATMWIAVTVHKANTDFFDLPQSCAVQLYEQGRRLLIGLPPLDRWWPEALPPSVLAIEAAIAIGLLVRAARPYAILLGFAFHVLSGAAVPSFAGVAFALYVPFAEPAIVDRSLGWLADLFRRWPIVVWVLDAALVVMAIGIVGNGVANLTGGPVLTEERTAGLAVLVTGVLAGVPFAVGLVRWRRSRNGAEPPIAAAGSARGGSWLAIGAVVVVGLIGLAPYLGLRTENSLSMYSNLRTEGDTGNHWLIPAALQVFGTQDELPRVVSLGREAPDVTGAATKLGASLEEVRFVEADLARRLRLHCGSVSGPTPARIDLGSGPVPFDDVCADDDLLAPAGLLWDRVLLYRPVPDANICRH